jgi:hypothetical protein
VIFRLQQLLRSLGRTGGGRLSWKKGNHCSGASEGPVIDTDAVAAVAAVADVAAAAAAGALYFAAAAPTP